jgi:hypothetical protein
MPRRFLSIAQPPRLREAFLPAEASFGVRNLMAEPSLLQLAQELEWLGAELEYYGRNHAHQGFPMAGPAWNTFLEKQRGVLATADKTERMLKQMVHYNPTALVGVDYPLEAALDSVTLLLGALEEIKQTAVYAVHDLPAKVREFTSVVADFLSGVAASRR